MCVTELNECFVERRKKEKLPGKTVFCSTVCCGTCWLAHNIVSEMLLEECMLACYYVFVYVHYTILPKRNVTLA